MRGIFQAFGIVQTCIVNVDKRHAFVKMLSRNDAVTAKEGMERYKSAEMQLRVSPYPLSPFKAPFGFLFLFLFLFLWFSLTDLHNPDSLGCRLRAP